MIKKIINGFLGCLVISLIVIFLIHLCFKIPAINDFFIPDWDASNVLEFFGVILGISVTVISLIIANYESSAEQRELHEFQIRQEWKKTVNEYAIKVLTEFSYTKIDVITNRILTLHNKITPFDIQASFNEATEGLDNSVNALFYFLPEKKEEPLQKINKIVEERYHLVMDIKKFLLQSFMYMESNQTYHFLPKEKDLQDLEQKCFKYILENTDTIIENLKLITNVEETGDQK